MGVYNIYDGAQLKVGDCDMDVFEPGDKVWLEDGVYLAMEGAVVVKGGILIGCFHNIQSKWGNKFDLDELLDSHNPIKGEIRNLMG